MATFQRRARKDGKVSVTASIRIKKEGVIIHQENKTFSKGTNRDNERNAKIWAKKREAEIEIDGIPKAALQPVTLAELAAVYLNDPNIKRMGRSKVADIKRISAYDIAQQPIQALSVADYVAHTDWRLTQAQPQTVQNDLIWIGELLDYAAAQRNITGTRMILDDARKLLRKTGKIAKPRKRERLPTPDEHERLLKALAEHQARSTVPILDILLFAQYSTRRQSEITRLRWDDNNPKYKTGLIRDLKDPRNKDGNHRRFQYTDEAWAIVQRQPRESEVIFPYNSKTTGTYLRQACNMTGIDDLRFHDYRHWAVSFLFASGWQIHEVTNVTLHVSWNTLKGYTHQSPEEREMIMAVDQLTRAFSLEEGISLG